MIKDITIGQYIPGESFVHKLDPRTKILISILFIISLFVVDKFAAYSFVVAFLILVICTAKIPFRFVYKGLKPVFLLIALTGVLNLFMVKGGELLFSFGFIKIYELGLRTAVFMAIRLILLTDGIERLLRPIGKEIAHELAMMMTIALRFIPTLMDETDKIMKAQKARGADFETGNILQKAKNLIPLLIPLFISSFKRADELAMAMEARCYRGGVGRTRMKVLKFTSKDIIAFALFAVVFASIIATRIFL